MDPQHHTYSSSNPGYRESNAAAQGVINIYDAQGLQGIRNYGVARLPGIGRGDGAGERQPLSSRPDLAYNNAQVTGNKRTHRVFSADAFCGSMDSQSLQPGQTRAPGWSSSGAVFQEPGGSRAPHHDSGMMSGQAPEQTVRRASLQHGLAAPIGAAAVGNPTMMASSQRVSSHAPTDNFDMDLQQTDVGTSARQSATTDDTGAVLGLDEDSDDSANIRMNLRYKLMLVKRIDQKMRLPGSWRWKTMKTAWLKGGIKEIVEEAHADWLALPGHERVKYGGDDRKTSTPRQSTFMQFLSQEKKKYRHWQAGARSTASLSGQYWRDVGPTIEAIVDQDACKSFREPCEAKEFALKAAVENSQHRTELRKAKQLASGNVTEVMEGLQETARALAEPNEEAREIQREQVDLCKANSLEMKEANLQDRRDAAERAQASERREKSRVEEVDARVKERAADREERNEHRRMSHGYNKRIASVLETSFPPLPKDARLPWETYAEFWGELPSVTQEQRAAVEKLCPTLRTLVKAASNKKVCDLLLDSTDGVLVKFTAELIASEIHDNVYKSYE